MLFHLLLRGSHRQVKFRQDWRIAIGIDRLLIRLDRFGLFARLVEALGLIPSRLSRFRAFGMIDSHVEKSFGGFLKVLWLLGRLGLLIEHQRQVELRRVAVGEIFILG